MPNTDEATGDAPASAGGIDHGDARERTRHVMELREPVERFVHALELELDAQLLLAVIDKAIDFFEQVFGMRYTGAEWQSLAARREVFRVLGPVFGGQIAEAYARNDRAIEERVALQVAAELSKPRPGIGPYSDEMLRLDPDCWSLQPCGERRAAYLRLSQLCELVRLQNEKAVAESRAGQERMPGGLLRKEEQEALRSALVRAIQLPRDRVVPAVAARKRYWLSWFRELFAPRRDEIDAAPAVLQMPPPPARDESDDALRAANALGERAAPRQDRQAV